MGNFKTRGIVLKAADLKENDKLITIFTEKLGKVTCVVRGARRSKSRYLSSTLTFAFGEYVLYRGKNLYTLEDFQCIDSFQDLLEDLKKLTYASYLCELIYISIPDEESNRELFNQFGKAMYMLRSGAISEELIARSFELTLLRKTGLGFNLQQCCICKSKIQNSNYINLEYNGGVCNKCEKVNGIYVSTSTYNIASYLNRTPIEKLYRVSIPEGNLKELYNLNLNIISANFMKRPKSLDMLNYIDGSVKNE